MKPVSSLVEPGEVWDRNYQIDDWQRCESDEPVWLAGVQGIVSLPILQARADRQRGLNTEGFISGYRGSPLASYDIELRRAEAALRQHRIRYCRRSTKIWLQPPASERNRSNWKVSLRALWLDGAKIQAPHHNQLIVRPQPSVTEVQTC